MWFGFASRKYKCESAWDNSDWKGCGNRIDLGRRDESDSDGWHGRGHWKKKGWCRDDRDSHDDGGCWGGRHKHKKAWHRDKDSDGSSWKSPWKSCNREEKETPNSAPEITNVLDDDVFVISAKGRSPVVDIDATDPDGDTLIFTLSGDDADLFEIDEDTGVIRPAQADTQANADDTTLELTVTVSDDQGLTDQIDINIMLVTVA